METCENELSDSARIFAHFSTFASETREELNNRISGFCHLWEGDPNNAHLTEEEKEKIDHRYALLPYVRGERSITLRHNMNKGDPIELGFNDAWEIISVRKPGEEACLWKKGEGFAQLPGAPSPEKQTVIPRTVGSARTHGHKFLEVGTLRVDVTSIFVGLKRDVLTCVDWDEALRTTRQVSVPCHWYGKREWLAGYVIKIFQHQDGRIVVMEPARGSLLQNWPAVWIWIPTTGQAGVLSTIFSAP